MLKAMAPYTSFPLKLRLANLWLFKPLLVKQLPNISREAAQLLGTTCAFNDLMTEAGGRRCTAQIVLRYLDEEDLKSDLTRLRTLATKHGIRVETLAQSALHRPSNPQSPVLRKLFQCIHEVFPDVPVIPFVLSENSDARFFSELSDCVLRFSPLRLTAQQLASARSDDENVDIACIGAAVVFYRQVLEGYTAANLREDPEEEDLEEWEELPEEPVPVEPEMPEDPLDFAADFLTEEPSYLPEESPEETADDGMPLLYENPEDFDLEGLSGELLEDFSEDTLDDILDMDFNTFENWEELT